jgi:hypothetical protein
VSRARSAKASRYEVLKTLRFPRVLASAAVPRSGKARPAGFGTDRDEPMVRRGASRESWRASGSAERKSAPGRIRNRSRRTDGEARRFPRVLAGQRFRGAEKRARQDSNLRPTAPEAVALSS